MPYPVLGGLDPRFDQELRGDGLRPVRAVSRLRSPADFLFPLKGPLGPTVNSQGREVLEPDRYKITIREAIADRGYGSAAIIRTLQQQGIEATIPLWSGRVGNSKYLKGGLVYEKERDRFRCPQGKYLHPNPAICANHQRYASSAKDCRDCPMLSTCPTEAVKKFPHRRYVRRNVDQDLFEEVQSRMRDPVFGEKMSERMWKIEGLFAEAKQNHGLSRARYRGRSKVQIQAYLSATVQNLKRLVALFYCWLFLGLLHRRYNITQLA